VLLTFNLTDENLTLYTYQGDLGPMDLSSSVLNPAIMRWDYQIIQVNWYGYEFDLTG